VIFSHPNPQKKKKGGGGTNLIKEEQSNKVEQKEQGIVKSQA